jgi:hypothetical protein
MRKYWFILILFIFPLDNFAQTTDIRHTYNLDLTLPNSMSNKAFEDIMQGLVNASTYYQYTFKNGFNLGAGIRYAYFTINEFRVPEPVSGGLHSGAAFLKLGWQKFFNETLALDFGVKAGYSQNYFLTNLNDSIGANPFQVNAIYAEPTLSLILMADERTSFRFYLGYGMQDFVFLPSMLGLSTNGGYVGDKIKSKSGYLLFGFGFSFYFSNKQE